MAATAVTASRRYVTEWARRTGSAIRPRPWPPLPEILTAQFDWKDQRVLLVGVMHGHKDSFDIVRKVLNRVKPEAVVLELEPSWEQARLAQANLAPKVDAAPSTDKKAEDPVLKALEQGQWLLAYQRAFGFPATQFSYEKDTPEIVFAYDHAKELGIPTVLADRSNEVRCAKMGTWISSLRVYHNLSRKHKLYSLINIPLLHYLPKPPDPPAEARPDYASMRAWVEDRNGVIFPDPAMQLVLMHERDLYMAQKIQAVQAGNVVAIVGMAHVPGMIAFWDRAHAVAVSVLDTPKQGFQDSIALWLSVHGPDGALAKPPPAEPELDERTEQQNGG